VGDAGKGKILVVASWIPVILEPPAVKSYSLSASQFLLPIAVESWATKSSSKYLPCFRSFSSFKGRNLILYGEN
jgi:hypothetical protein